MKPEPVVYALRTKPETILEDYDRLIEMAGVDQILSPKTTTILKNNISWHLLFPGANTTPWQLEAAIVSLRKRGFDDLVCVQNRTVVTDPHKGELLNGYKGLYLKYGLPVKFNFRPADMRFTVYRPRGRMLVLDKIFRDGIRIPDYFHGKNIVHLPTVKCHIYTTTTGAMKNAFGGLLSDQRHYCHSHIHETLVDLLRIQQEIHPGIFCLMDGTTAGNGPGPRTMTPVVKNVILAGADQVAIDAVAAKLMGFAPLDLKFIRLAHEDGLGTGDPRDIKLRGDDLSGENWRFAVGDNVASRAGDLFWFGPLKPLQRLAFHTPAVYGFIYASYIYHDFVHYPRRGLVHVRDWLRTPWGRLFDRYMDEQERQLTGRDRDWISREYRRLAGTALAG